MCLQTKGERSRLKCGLVPTAASLHAWQLTQCSISQGTCIIVGVLPEEWDVQGGALI
jgi:hypothetical protein